MSATKPEKIYTYYGASQLGTGTSVESITRARDEFADRQYWKENSNLSKNEKAQYVLGKIETVFEEPSDTGFQTVLNKFWKTFQSLGTKGSDYSARVQVRDTAKELGKEAGKGLLLAIASFAICYGCDWLCGFSQAKKGQGR